MLCYKKILCYVIKKFYDRVIKNFMHNLKIGKHKNTKNTIFGGPKKWSKNGSKNGSKKGVILGGPEGVQKCRKRGQKGVKNAKKWGVGVRAKKCNFGKTWGSFGPF
jgi:hypothetical protein